ncbi:MAG: hypothetical protein VCE91_02025 [Nitrospinota bacterium]
MHRTVSGICAAAALGFLIAGCAGGPSGDPSTGIWKRSRNAAVSVYDAARSAVNKTIRIFSGAPTIKPREVGAPPKRPAARRPTGPAPDYEAGIKSGRLTPIVKPQIRGAGQRIIRLIPHEAKSPAEVRREITELTKGLEGEKNPSMRDFLIRKRRRLKRVLEKSLK